MELFCIACGRSADLRLKTWGSGPTYERRHFVEQMERAKDGEIKKIVVARHNRLVRFGFAWFDAFCNFHGAEIVVVNAGSLPT